jgi:hypothetical protein
MKNIRRFSKVFIGLTIVVVAQTAHAEVVASCGVQDGARVVADACIEPALEARKLQSVKSNASLIDDFDFGGHAALLLAGVVAVLSLSRRRQLH